MSYRIFKNKFECCGCTACVNSCPTSAIKLSTDCEGFSYAEIDKNLCVKCGICKSVCPFQRDVKYHSVSDQSIYACKATDKKIQLESSSGGLFTLLSNEILSLGGIIYGAAFDKNHKVKHIRATSESQRDLCRGSKYSQSELKSIFLDVYTDLNSNKIVMFTGTPCQIAGLKNFLNFKKTDTNNLILVDMVCHGTPSPKLFSEYIRYIEKIRRKKIDKYIHRSKDLGWDHFEKIIYDDGYSEINTPLSESWKCIFQSENILRPSCYHCKFANKLRCSDITIADFWGIKMFDPNFYDPKGVSLAIINSEKGNELFSKISSFIEYKLHTFEEASLKNPNLLHPSKEPATRAQFWNEYKAKGIPFIIKKYGKFNLERKIKFFIKKILGKI